MRNIDFLKVIIYIKKIAEFFFSKEIKEFDEIFGNILFVKMESSKLIN